MKLLILCCLIVSTSTLFFPSSGGGGGGCCCGCGTPQPASCGCGPVCPPPQPCPSCPPPPTAICPQVQPIYIPACSGGGCGGGYSSGGCGGGSCGGGGYSASSGGGYATSGGGGGGYATSGGGGFSAPVAQVAPASGYASSGSSASFSAPVGNEAGYSAGGGGGGGYQQHVAAADDPKGGESGPIPPPPQTAAIPNLNQAFRSPQICEPQKIKYVVLRAKKLHGRPGEETLEEEAEEIERPTSLEATSSPLDPKEVGDELLHGDEELGDADGGIQARGAPTLSDAKCNSKPLRDLIMENIVRDDALASKRQIHETSIKRFPEHTVDVICSTTGFTYLVSTTEHCEAQRDNVICFVYKRPI